MGMGGSTLAREYARTTGANDLQKGATCDYSRGRPRHCSLLGCGKLRSSSGPAEQRAEASAREQASRQSSVSVTVGPGSVSDTCSLPGHAHARCSIVLRQELLGAQGNRLFLRCQRSEGAAGNHYFTLSYSTVCRAQRYEVVLTLPYSYRV